MDFGKKLEVLRKEKGLTQLELADALEISEYTVSQLEDNSRPPTYKVLNKILDYFNVTADYMLGYKCLAPITFGKRLRLLRKEKDLTIEELGGILNLKKFNISNYENGKRMPSLQTVYFIAEYFEVSIDYLLGRVDKREMPIS